MSGRFFDESNNKQYAVDSDEYSRFLDFLYALKTGKLDLPDEVTFEASEWAKDEVNEAIENGLVPEWNRINYKGNITRLEVCMLVENFMHVKKIPQHTDVYAAPPFLDVEDSSITYLWNNNIINGKAETLFCPYDVITREEFAKILFSTYQCVESDIINSSGSMYEDQCEISNWAIDSVNSMTSLGLFNGNANGEFGPQKNITKEEVILTLLRFSKIIG